MGLGMTAHPKPTTYRDANLLKMARGREPVASLPGNPDHPTTTVAAHGNFLFMGKSKGKKAHDFFVIYVGYHFHAWLDQGMASKAEKLAAFWCAYRVQLELWIFIALDKTEKTKDRESALNAVAAFSEWVAVNQHMFEGGDWQLEYLTKD